METKFNLVTKDLKLVLNQIAKLKPGFFKKNEFLKIRVLPETVEISSLGIIRSLVSNTEGLADISVPAIIIKGYADTTTSSLMSFAFKQGEVTIGSSIFSSPGITMETLFNIPENEIPINATNMYLLCFAETKTEDQIKKIGVEHLINKAKRDLKKNINGALNILEQYSITYDDILSLIQKKIKEKQ